MTQGNLQDVVLTLRNAARSGSAYDDRKWTEAQKLIVDMESRNQLLSAFIVDLLSTGSGGLVNWDMVPSAGPSCRRALGSISADLRREIDRRLVSGISDNGAVDAPNNR